MKPPTSGVDRAGQASMLRFKLRKLRRKIREADAKGEKLRAKAERILIEISRLENSKAT